MMKPTVRALGVTALLLALSPQLASAAPALFDPNVFPNGNGHYYEVRAAVGLTWQDARDAAYASTFTNDQGRTFTGHLATLTSPEEDTFVEGLVAAANLGEVWAGGFQKACATPSPGCGWAWINNDGPIPGVNGGALYAKWHTGEPNDNYGTNSEEFLGIHFDGAFWNDEGALGNIGGFVVEYDVIDATTCGSADGCDTTTGQNLKLPIIPPDGSTMGVSTLPFTDTRTCGTEPLSLFDGKLVIPSYLCGSPDFLVVKTSPSFDVPSGTVRIENQNNILPGNTANKCSSPVTGAPEEQAVVVWQADNYVDMHESTHAPSSDYLPGIGYAGEFTNGCGSSLGSVRGGSYHVIGMHIGFAPDTKELDGYIALTSYKLQLLQVAVKSASDDGAITKAQYNSLSAKSDNAAKLFGRGLYGPTLNQLNQMVTDIQRMNIKQEPYNHEGDLEMRARNLAFTIQAKVIPLAQ